MTETKEWIDYDECPRCGFLALERLSTHTYCADCNFSPDFEDGTYIEIPNWVIGLPVTSPHALPPTCAPRSKEAA